MAVPGEQDELPGSASARAFHLVRRHALITARQERVSVFDPPTVGKDPCLRATTVVPVAQPGALVLLKAVALPRRVGAQRAEKVVSDIQDVVRLVASRGVDALMAEASAAPTELLGYAGQVLTKRFGEDGRYLQATLRRAGVLGMEPDDLALVAEFGHVLVGAALDR